MGNDQYDPTTMKFIKTNDNASSYWKLPRIFFYGPTKPYHPHIHPITGELNLSWYFKQWDEKRHHIWHCLKCLKHIFYSKLSKTDLQTESQIESSNQQSTKSIIENHTKNSKPQISSPT